MMAKQISPKDLLKALTNIIKDHGKDDMCYWNSNKESGCGYPVSATSDLHMYAYCPFCGKRMHIEGYR
jgi:hypothetical protein